ncbi:MAG TPA: acyl-CoA dehydrogenase family protein [Candidatus Angelobacter sp.]|nr:acyl-CoA dehydrogenase family protein [Candidatus Angelobacter sp.]
MQFGLSESQQILKDTARKFFAGECPIASVRKAMENETAYDAAVWSKLADQGFTGIITPEDFGGMGLGKVELVLLMEEAGYALLPGPFFSTVALAGPVVDALGTPAQKKKYLGGIAAGSARATVAFVEEEGCWNPAALHLTANGDRLTGTKLFVSDAGVADFIIVVARNGVYAVEAKAPGMRIAPMKGMDLTRKIYSVEFKDTPAEKLAGNGSLSKAMDAATVALCAEMIGGMQRVLETTVAYAKTRKQFGKPIGIFQAVQHLCADMYLETESSRSAAYYASWALEEHTPDAALAVSVAKMYASDACRTVGNRGIQVHGGMGFTWENDIHLYYRRAKSSETMLGDAIFHRERIAQLVIDGAAMTGSGVNEQESAALAAK